MKKKQNVTRRVSGRASILRGVCAAISAIAVLIAAPASLTITTQAYSTPAHVIEVSSEVSTGEAMRVEAAQQSPPSQLTVTFTGQGVTPSSATVSAGLVHLTIENQSGHEQLTLRVTRQGGEVVREINVAGKNLSTELPLEAGQYVLSETSNSTSACQLTVQ